MNKVLQWTNLAGVLALALLCIWQWRVNRSANLEIYQLDKIRFEQQTQLVEQEKQLTGAQADLENFRNQLNTTLERLKQTESQSILREKEIHQLTAERDQLKTSVVGWSEAVAARDTELKQMNGQLQELAAERNQAATKFNDLAEKHNHLVKELNDANSKLAKIAASQASTNH